MILDATITSQPSSGELKERIYDNKSAWNSPNWTFVKFIDSDYNEWCGQFRGSPRNVAISSIYGNVLVLTLDYLYQLNKENGDLIEIEDQPQYRHLTSAPDGSIILADHYNLVKLTTSIKNKEELKSPIEMDNIELGNWDKTKLEFSCAEFTNWDRHLLMTYDCETNKIEIKNSQ